MTRKNNYLRKDPFSSFSQLTLDDVFYKKILGPTLNSLSQPHLGEDVEHTSQEYSITMLINALTGQSQNTGTQILEHKISSLLKPHLERFIKDTRVLPHPSQMTSYARNFSMEEVDTMLLERSRDVLSWLLKMKKIPVKIKVAFDLHKELNYGEMENPYVIGIKAEKGTKKAYFWHTCAIIVKGLEVHVGSEMITSRANKEVFVRKMICFLRSIGFIIELVVLDKEYYDKDIINLLDSQDIEYILPVKESPKLKALKKKALKHAKKRVQKYEMNDTYVKGRGQKKIPFNITFFAKKKLTMSALRTQYKNGSRDLARILEDIFVLATNRLVAAPSVQKKYKFYKIRSDYGGRWRIEVTYRETNPFITYSTSTKPEVRNLYFVIACLLYNLWILANLWIHTPKRWVEKEPKAFFTVYLCDQLITFLQFHLGRGLPQSEFCREEELNILRCIIM